MPELDKHTCRACGDTYLYPKPGGAATRFYCEACAGVDPAVRRVLEGMNRRLTRLQAEVAALRAEAKKPSGGPTDE